MAKVKGYGVVRNGEHVSRHDTREDAEAAAAVEREAIKQAAADGWITERGANESRVWVEEIRCNVW